jgi:hypothetical protein
MRREMSEKVPHVVGKSSELIYELIEGLGKSREGASGKE